MRPSSSSPLAAVTLGTIVTAAVLRLAAPHGGTLGAQDDPPTYAKDVAPILYRNCATCHRPGGLGPFSVLDYDTAAAHAKDIRKMVRTGAMPPSLNASGSSGNLLIHGGSK